MSRIGKLPIIIPTGVTVAIKSGLVQVSGPKGKLTLTTAGVINVTEEEGRIIVKAKGEGSNALWGTTRANINNAVIGVTTGWQKSLEMVGVGFRSAVREKTLEVSAGFSHVVVFPIPEGISIAVEANTRIAVSGIDKVLVGQTAAKIRKIRKPEPYKGKGIKYTGEVIRRKAGKSGKAGAASK